MLKSIFATKMFVYLGAALMCASSAAEAVSPNDTEALGQASSKITITPNTPSHDSGKPGVTKQAINQTTSSGPLYANALGGSAVARNKFSGANIDQVSADAGENIDLRSGRLFLEVADVSVPGNGGLDITITRQYQKRKLTNYEVPHAMGNWDIGIPRISGNFSTSRGDYCQWPYPGQSFYPLTQSNRKEYYRVFNGTKMDLPGQATTELLLDDYDYNNDPGAFIYGTVSSWFTNSYAKIDCADIDTPNGTIAGGGFRVKTPDGKTYTFDKRSVARTTLRDNTQLWPNWVQVVDYYPSKIEDRKGNTLTFEYASYSQLYPAGSPGDKLSADAPLQQLVPTRITASDGREVVFRYYPAQQIWASANPMPLLKEIETEGRVWHYNYNSKSELVEVVLPSGEKWEYEYSGEPESLFTALGLNGSGNRNTPDPVITGITYPTGGTINYTYQTVNPTAFGGFRYSDPPGASQVETYKAVYTKTTGGPDIQQGAWLYQLELYFTNNERRTETTITGPARTRKYDFRYPELDYEWGTLLSSSVIDTSGTTPTTLQSTSYDYGVTTFFYGLAVTPFSDFTRARAIEKPKFLFEKTVSRDSGTYTTGSNGYFPYGSPTDRMESGPGGASITRNFEYFSNSAGTSWLFGLLKKTDISGVGTALMRQFAPNGNIDQETRYGVTSTFDYFTNGDLKNATNASGNTTQYLDYFRGTPRQIVDAESNEVDRVVNPEGTTASITDARGKTTSFQYDGLNRVTAVDYPLGADATITYAPRQKVETRGNFQRTTDYDGFGRAIRVAEKDTSSSTASVVERAEYDALGRQIFQTDASTDGSATDGIQTQYDALNRVVKRTATADGSQVTHDYLANNREQITDATANVVTRTYRSFGNPGQKELTKVEAPEGITTNISRDLRGNVTQTTINGVTRSYNYNANNFLASETSPELGTATYGLDAVGNVISRQVGSSTPTTYSYDAINQLTAVDYPTGTSDVSVTYDASGNAVNLVKGGITRSYTYDDNGNQVTNTLSDGTVSLEADFDFDNLDNLRRIHYPAPSNAVVDYLPDALGRATQAAPYISKVKYYPSGQPKRLEYANGEITDFTLDSRQRVGRIHTFGVSNAVDLNYGYDATSNVTSVNNQLAPSYNRTLTYDGVNRLKTANGVWGQGHIGYDPKGNITQYALGSSTLNYGYDSQNRLSSLSGSQSRALAYDEYGNFSDNGTNEFFYGADDNLQAVLNGPTYSYDGNNRMAMRTEGPSTRYVMYVAGEARIFEYNAQSGEYVQNIYLNGRRVATQDVGGSSNGNIVSLHHDALGSPVAATNKNGALLWQESYTPFGKRLRNEPAAQENQYAYTGKFHEDSFDQSYYGARWYEAGIGRFAGIDPVGVDAGNLHTFNRYAYAANSPYVYVDPDGRFFETGFDVFSAGLSLYGLYNDFTVANFIGAAVDVGAVFVPFVPGGYGLVRFGARGLEAAPAVVKVSKSRFPESARHIEDAVAAGKPNTLTIDRANAASRRRDALRDTQTKPGLDRDEFPPAMFEEGGKGSSVRHINSSDNRGAGACIGAQCRALPNRTRVRIDVVE